MTEIDVAYYLDAIDAATDRLLSDASGTPEPTPARAVTALQELNAPAGELLACLLGRPSSLVDPPDLAPWA